MKKSALTLSVICILSLSLFAGQAKVVKETVPGITNMARLETTVACAGAIKPESVAEIKKMGFKSVINLREPSEKDANVEAEGEAAKAAGIQYINIPFNSATPDPASVDKFVKTISSKGFEPAFIHCAGGNRAAAMWYVKRALVDKWDDARAMAEATELGFSSATLKAFMTDYVQKHRK